MEYSISELAQLAGVSARTLRYYDEIHLLKPAYVNGAGYRYYGEKEVAILQQILFYRERKFDLKQIQKIISEKDFDIMHALEEHLLGLEEQKKRMDSLIQMVKQTIQAMKGAYQMSDKQKFESFKKDAIEKNETNYGKEIREKYGDEAVNASNRKLMTLSEEQWSEFQNLEDEIRINLEQAARKGKSPESEAGKEIVALHKKWLSYTWKQYSAKAHKDVASMYVADKRFKAYYDKEIAGCAEFLSKAIRYWVESI